MEPSHTVTIDADLWERTQFELYKLRQENLALSSRVRQLQAEAKGTSFKARLSMTQASLDPPSLENSPHNNERLRFKNQMTQWLSSLNKRHLKVRDKEIEYCLKRALSGIEEELDEHHGDDKRENGDHKLDGPKVQETKAEEPKAQQLEKEKKKQKLVGNGKIEEKVGKEMKLIESICLFGPGEGAIRDNISNRRMLVNNNLLYSVNKQQEQKFSIYGEYFCPEGLVAAKCLREQEAPTQINQVIFRKNTKKQDCSLFLFQGDENNEELKMDNPLLSRINTRRWLFAFVVQFSDFEALSIEQSIEIGEDKNNKSVSEYVDEEREHKVPSGRESDRVYSNKKFNTHYVKGKYTLCIFTYFPIISLMESLLSSILDEVKIRRVEKFSNTNQKSDVSIKFFIDELAKVGLEIYGQIQKIPCSFGEQTKIGFGNVQILVDMNEQRFDQLIFSGWVHDILKLFEKDLIFQIFTNMMTEESICFVSENMHLLTYVIFFFVCVLTFPFAYPHPCISNVLNYELLESPFVVVAGVNQSSKWLDQNAANYPKKIFVDLNDEARVKGKKKPKSIKSEKLKKIFNSLYKKIESGNSPVPQIFKKKQTIIRPASREQNSTAIAFLKSLQSYYTEEVFIFLPNPAIISHIRDRIEEKNETSKIFSILKEIEKYLKESRKHKEKDQFIDMLIQQQIFYVYMGAKYQLD